MNNGFFGFPLADLNQSAGEKVNVSGRLLRISRFTSSGNWLKQKDVGFIIVELLGGGGGGGGAQGSVNYSTAGSSGAGGGGCMKKIDAAALGPAETVTIGTGGTGGSSTPSSGGMGGTTSFGAHCSASGGEGGQSALVNPAVGGATAQGGIGIGGDINYRGSAGAPNHSIYATIGNSYPGGNGSSPLGGSGAQGVMTRLLTDSYDGLAADVNSGGGGSGGAPAYDNAASKKSGGNGGSGLCVVYEFS